MQEWPGLDHESFVHSLVFWGLLSHRILVASHHLRVNTCCPAGRRVKTRHVPAQRTFARMRNYAAFFILAQRALCAFAILALASADK